MNEPKKLYRLDHGMLAGVCGGVAEYTGLDLTLVRVLMVLFTLFGGSGLLVYIVMWIIVPNEPRDSGMSNERRRK